ncbi:hypothetical protein [Flavobacterium sp. GNP002]
MSNQNPFKKNSKPYLFFELAKPDINGQSRIVSVEEFKGEFEKLKMGNGGDWCRSDSSLAQKFIVVRNKNKNSICSVQLFGLNTKNQIKKNIRADIKVQITKMRCAILDISSVEVDHKDGHRDDFNNFQIENQKIDQFQPLSKAANNAKKNIVKNVDIVKKDLMLQN